MAFKRDGRRRNFEHFEVAVDVASLGRPMAALDVKHRLGIADDDKTPQVDVAAPFLLPSLSNGLNRLRRLRA